MSQTEILLLQVDVADELKRLISRPKRLPFLPALRRLAGVDEEHSAAAAGMLVRHFLLGAISSLSGMYEFDGKQYEAEKMRRVYRVLFGFDAANCSVINRRYRAMRILGIPWSDAKWRRDPERDFVLIFAEHMSPAPYQNTS